MHALAFGDAQTDSKTEEIDSVLLNVHFLCRRLLSGLLLRNRDRLGNQKCGCVQGREHVNWFQSEAEELDRICGLIVEYETLRFGWRLNHRQGVK